MNRTEMCQHCGQEVPVGEGCNESQARECVNMSGRRSREERDATTFDDREALEEHR